MIQWPAAGNNLAVQNPYFIISLLPGYYRNDLISDLQY